MSQTNRPETVRLKSIFHPSDFSAASEVAFAHALKIALVAGTELALFHVESSPSAKWQDFPAVRHTLERWKLLPKGSPRSAAGQLGIDVEKVIAAGQHPGEGCLGFCKNRPL